MTRRLTFVTRIAARFYAFGITPMPLAAAEFGAYAPPKPGNGPR
jgi:hypothetical protein